MAELTIWSSMYVSLPEKVKARLKAEAEEEHRTISAQLLRIIEVYYRAKDRNSAIETPFKRG